MPEIENDQAVSKQEFKSELPIHEIVERDSPSRMFLKCHPKRELQVVKFMLKYGKATLDPSKVTCRYCLSAAEENDD